MLKTSATNHNLAVGLALALADFPLLLEREREREREREFCLASVVDSLAKYNQKNHFYKRYHIFFREVSTASLRVAHTSLSAVNYQLIAARLLLVVLIDFNTVNNQLRIIFNINLF
jgi:hypothetical protein